ncbi:MAG: helix-turn-helix transcriptional regulator [Acidimicrobiia bacterium]
MPRPQIVGALSSFGGRVVVISAAAGYGKSTVTAEWVGADERAHAWLTLDEADRDPVVFLTYLGIALHEVEPVPDPLLDVLTRVDVDIPTIVAALEEVLSARLRPFVLVLDDVHHLRPGPSRDVVLRALVAHVPPGSVVALVTRESAPLPTCRAVLAGETMVVDAHDLALTREEVGAVLRSEAFEASPEVVDALWQRTEGWVAGVALAALALRGVHSIEPAQLANAVRGSERRTRDYFTDEVLAALGDDDAEFLLATAVLGPCSGPLCDAVLGRTDSGSTLARLARENCFVTPMDESATWYRYHALFEEMLASEMQGRDAARAREVARRASDWHAAQGDGDRAIALALSAGDRDLAARLVWQFAPQMQNAGRIDTVARWIDRFRAEEIMGTACLAVPAAWNALVRGEIDELQRLAASLDRSCDGSALPDGTDPWAAAALLRAITGAGGLGEMREMAAKARAGHRDDSPYRALATFLEASAAGLLGDVDAAWDLNREGARLARTVLVPVHAHLLAHAARLDLATGNWEAALGLVGQALAVVEEHGLADRPAMALVLATASLVHVSTGDRERGDAERQRAIDLLDRLMDVSPYQVLEARLDLAWASALVADHRAARVLLGRSEHQVRSLGDAGVLPSRFDAVSRIVGEHAPRPGADLAEPLTPAEVRVLRMLPTHHSFGEIGGELFVSRNTVKSHAMAIYRKLGVSSRSAAVEEAVRQGYLAG